MKHISESIIGRRGADYNRKISNPTFDDIVRGCIVYIPDCANPTRNENPYFLGLTSRDLYNLWPDRYTDNTYLLHLIHYSPPTKYSAFDTPIGDLIAGGFDKHFPFYDDGRTPIEAVYTPIDKHQLSKILSSEKTLIDFLKNLHP